jgi:ABC-type phosphate transport system substrate-binding protein
MAMKNIRPALILFAGILISAFALLSAISTQPVSAAGGRIVVIVNAANPVDNLGLIDVKKLFLSDRSKWDSGKLVAPVMVAAGAPERTVFLKIVCGMNEANFDKYFVIAVFSGKSVTPPKEVANAANVKIVVSNSPGAIGFVKSGDLSAADTTIKAVKIDGLAASDPAYKIK